MNWNLFNRFKRRVSREILVRVNRSPYMLQSNSPIISFTFDDIPISAKNVGASMLNEYGIKGTFYISYNLINKKFFNEHYCSKEDIEFLIQNGHEIGCHTYDHLNSEIVSKIDYEVSIKKNKEAFSSNFFGYKLKSFSYPYGGVNLSGRSVASKYYKYCRTNWPGLNLGLIDTSLLKANSIYSNLNNLDHIAKLIENNAKLNSWLILYTHDISENPSIYGSTPIFFRRVIDLAIHSGAKLTTISDALIK